MVGEDLFLQYGALGLAGLVSYVSITNGFKSNEKMQEVINKNSDAIMKLSETLATCPKKE